MDLRPQHTTVVTRASLMLSYEIVAPVFAG
jgi:hypothetical protein